VSPRTRRRSLIVLAGFTTAMRNRATSRRPICHPGVPRVIGIPRSVLLQSRSEAMRCNTLHCVAKPMQIGCDLRAATSEPSRALGATASAAPACSACGKIQRRKEMPVSAVTRNLGRNRAGVTAVEGHNEAAINRKHAPATTHERRQMTQPV